MIKAGIIGSTGYAGAELVRLLLQHPEAEIVWYGSRSYTGQKYADIYRNMFQIVDADCLGDDLDELAKQADVIFTATPQGFCASVIGDDQPGQDRRSSSHRQSGLLHDHLNPNALSAREGRVDRPEIDHCRC